MVTMRRVKLKPIGPQAGQRTIQPENLPTLCKRGGSRQWQRHWRIEQILRRLHEYCGLGGAPSYSTKAIGPSVPCKIYGYGASRGGAEIDDCIAGPNGHIDPSLSVQRGGLGNWSVGPQMTTMATAAQEWPFMQRFTLPGNP